MVPIIMPEIGEIPGDIVDLESFRRWARSAAFPERGRFSYLAGKLWVDLSLEQLFTHNQVKTRFVTVLGNLMEDDDLGYYFTDRARLSSPHADLSTEPDTIFVSYEAVRNRRVFFAGAKEWLDEIVGSPDMVLEVMSEASVHRDTEVLRQLYWVAEVSEYWLVDVREAIVRFDILRRGKRGYTAVRAQNGWLHSRVFGRSFRLTKQADPLGHPRYTLEVRE